MPGSRSNRPQPHPISRWPTGTSYEDVFDFERELREEVEKELDLRIQALEDRILIVEQYEGFCEQYPELKAAYDKFREEESKMLTFEALKKKDGNE